MASRVRSRVSKPARLIYAESEHSADQFYFTGFRAPDPFLALQVGRRKIGVLSALEFGRARKESRLDEVLSLEALQAEVGRRTGNKRPGIAAIVRELTRRFGVRTLEVPADFPAGLAFALQEQGLKIQPVAGAFLPEREVKDAEQARAIREGNRCSALGLRAAEELLRRARIRGGRLWLDGRVLTSERVREEIEIACLRAGAVALGTIVAGGEQACDPHQRGSGPLRARELIIVDVFPRVAATGYHGDMTRTFLKGEPSEAQARLVAAVRSAQRRALEAIRPGVSGERVHKGVSAHFESLGYETRSGPDGSAGFFHGTGHGLGLEVHEPPRLSRGGPRLKSGTVVTVEPGLYYPGLGGCRIEDVVQVKPEGPQLLSRFHYRWILP